MAAVDVLAKGVPFQDAIDYFRQKVNLSTERWTDIWQGMHSRAFVVAGATKAELLTDFRQAVDKAIAEGTTLAEFRKDFDAIVARHGWKYKGGRGWRTSVIFNTNCRVAYAAGHHQQMTDPYVLDRRPFWRYVAVKDGRTRPLHRAWHNTVLKHDDPWWQTHYPPNGWGCRCTVVSQSAKEIERLRAEGENIKRTAPDVEVRQWENPATGEIVQVPEGIDPGWAYNPGETAWGRNQALRLMEDQGPWRDLVPWGPEQYGLPKKLPIDSAQASLGPVTKKGDVDALRRALSEALGADEASFLDPIGETIMAGQAIVDHILQSPDSRWDGREAYFPLIPELIRQPAEIWINFAVSEISGRVALRRRYVKFVQIGGKKIVGMWAETQNGLWVAQDFFRGEWSGAKRLRQGRLLYARER